MSANGKFYALQFLAGALWMAGMTVLFVLGLQEFWPIWMGVCVAVGLTSWTIGCPQCGRSVYLSHLNNTFGRGPLAVCSKCGFDLKYGRLPGTKK